MQATEQSPTLFTVNSLSHTVSLSWADPGPKLMTVTVANSTGSATDVHAIHLASPLSSLLISGPSSGDTNTPYTFTASAGPLTAIQPITYRWQANGKPALIRSGGLTDSASYAWTTPGTQLIIATAFNGSGAVTDTFLFTTNAPPTDSNANSVYLPLVVKP